MSNTIIKIENISKKYNIGKREMNLTFRDALIAFARKPFNTLLKPETTSEFWALRDISFEVKEGEVLGIIGRNGSGKSTLLKILSQITEPTSGKITLHGRVGSLLEVGTGFNPELTGRENIFLNGSILGMSRLEIRKKFDEIVEFSGVSKFLDTPVKRYSSGMYVRLAFAVAAHLEPEILIVDEVLAVGDSEFQKKCMGKMSDVAKSGRTVLFVSHNMTAVQNLCFNVIRLDKGKVIESGDTNTIISNYLMNNTGDRLEQEWNTNEAPGNENGRVIYAAISVDNEDNLITTNTPIDITFRLLNKKNAIIWFNYLLYNMEDICIYNTASEKRNHTKGIIEATCHIPAHLLNDGIYIVRLYIHYEDGGGFYAGEVLTFQVHDKRDSDWYGKILGAVRPELKWKTRFSNL